LLDPLKTELRLPQALPMQRAGILPTRQDEHVLKLHCYKLDIWQRLFYLG
jgi:hypothetical protein